VAPTACRLDIMSEFESAVRSGASILTGGGIEAPIMFETDILLPSHVQVAALATDSTGGPVLRRIYESYVEATPSLRLRVLGGCRGTDDHPMQLLAARMARSCP
jgi:hypothetical protein